MNLKILTALAGIALVTGCTETRYHMGAAAETDGNVLTGGPVTGITLGQLPQAVRKTLRERMPTAEVADIDMERENGQIIYEISFVNPGRNPKLHVTETGLVVQE